jgi:DNA polymerase-1
VAISRAEPTPPDLRRHAPLGVVLLPGVGLGLATAEGSWSEPTTDPVGVVRRLTEQFDPRWIWWSAAGTARPAVAAGAELRRCWDLAAVHLLLTGGRRDDPAAVWAAAHGLALPPPVLSAGLLDFDTPSVAADQVVLDDGQLHPGFADGSLLTGPPAQVLPRAAQLAAAAVTAAARQQEQLAQLPDHRPRRSEPPLAVVTAHAESAVALLCVELETGGLPLDRSEAEALLGSMIGPRAASPGDEQRARRERDTVVQQRFPGGETVDLRNPLQVKEMLGRAGFDVPDTRSWRLEAFRDSHPGIGPLLEWRKAERIATTYGYGWLDTTVGADGRLRGAWRSADGAGRMTASAGLHNLPAPLRPAIVAEPGHVFVRADLGQVEPRVLAAVSGDPDLAAAAREDDLYTPVAERLRCDRPTAKVAVLAAMYGQTSGAAGQTLKQMERAYPTAIRFLRTAEQHGREGRDLRTWGGRLVRLGRPADADPTANGAGGPATAAAGRFARNAAVQGAAAELFKVWAATVRTGLLGGRGAAAAAQREPSGRIVLCLHDELLLQVPEGAADRVVALLHTALEQAVGHWASGAGVRFVADVSVVRRWSDAK